MRIKYLLGGRETEKANNQYLHYNEKDKDKECDLDVTKNMAAWG